MTERYEFSQQPQVEKKLAPQITPRLLAAIGNSEAKALLFAAMSYGQIYSESELHNLFMEIQGKNPAWAVRKYVPNQYCRQSFEPAGLVQEIKGEYGIVLGYTKTDFGEKTGNALAGLLLEFSERHDIPLYCFFGAANTKNPADTIMIEDAEIETRKGAAEVRLKILREIIKQPPDTDTTTLAKACGEETKRIGSHLEQLQRHGLVNYSHYVPGVDYALHQLAQETPSNPPKPYLKCISLTAVIYDILRSNPKKQFTVSEIADILKEKQGRYISHGTIRAILSALHQQGYTTRDSTHTNINLTNDQRELITELVNLIDRFENQNPNDLTHWKNQAERILKDEEKINSLLQRARRASPWANRHPFSETTTSIYQVIRENPGLTAAEIQKLFFDKYTHGTITFLLGKLVKAGSVRVDKEKHPPRYYLSNQP